MRYALNLGAGCCALLLLAAPVPAAGKPGRQHATGKHLHAAKGTRTGLASYYGKGLHGKKTAAGEPFDKNELVAAHPSYPLGTVVRVTNLRNGKSLDVRIADRGPTKAHQERGVIIDLSERAATSLGFRRQGKTRVKTEVLEWGGSRRE